MAMGDWSVPISVARSVSVAAECGATGGSTTASNSDFGFGITRVTATSPNILSSSASYSLSPHLPFSHSPVLIMSAPPPHNTSPPPGLVGSEQQSTGVRRHHTITAASRSARTAARAPISEESQDQDQQTWDDEELLESERVRSVGAVGEKGGSLHRQASLPARYNRGTSLVYQNLPVQFAILLYVYS